MMGYLVNQQEGVKICQHGTNKKQLFSTVMQVIWYHVKNLVVLDTLDGPLHMDAD